MKKNISIFISSVVLILLSFYIGNRYHFMYSSVCGTGIIGLKLVGIITGFILIAVLLFYLGKPKTRKIYCRKCLNKMEDTWKVCPYCGDDEWVVDKR